MLLVAAPSSAQDIRVRDGADARPVGEYAGVEPGEAQPPPALGRVARRRARPPRPSSILTWPGFTPQPDGGSRFFVQTTDPVMPEVSVEAGRVVLLFRNTRIHLRNSARWLETRFFDTPVARARLERRGRDMAFVLYLRAAATPRISTEPAPGAAFHYVYVDFPPGRYAPVQTVPSPPPAPAREVDPALDDERPPALR